MKTAVLAFRNLNRQKKRSFLLGGAIAFGIFIITMINGFTGSFVENVSENFSHLLAGHIFIDGVEKSESGKNISIIRDDTLLLEAVGQLNFPVRYLTKRSTFSGTLIFEGDSLMQNVSGVLWEEEEYLKERLLLVEGDFASMKNPKGIILSENTASRLNITIGDTLLVQLKTATGQQNVGDFVLAAIIQDPGFFGSLSAYANMEYVNQLLNISPKEYMTLGIFLDDLKYMNPASIMLYQLLTNKVNLFERSYQQEDTNIFQAMTDQAKEEKWEGVRYRLYTLNDMLGQVEQIVRALNIVGLVILVILFLIIMVGITNTFRMIMFERIREIGTMRSLGLHRKGVRRLFIIESLFLSLGGVLSGLLVSGILMLILSKISIGVESPLFLLLNNGHFTFKISPVQIIGNIAIVAVLTILAVLVPANKASKLEPADALRFRN